MVYHSGNELVDPYILFNKCHMQEGMHVADLGCGRTGHIVFPAATVVGEHGIVYAVDIMKDVLSNIEKRAKSGNLLNIHTVWSNVEFVGKTAIPTETLDIVFLVNTLHLAENKHHMLEEAKRLLKQKARLVIVDWSDCGLPFAPNKDCLIDFDEIVQWAFAHGFVLQDSYPVGNYHSGVTMYRNN